MKYLWVLGAVTIACFTIWSYGQSKERGGLLLCTNAGLKTDNAAIISSAQKMVSAYEQAQEGMKGLTLVKDDTNAGPAIDYALTRVCDQRKKTKYPCANPPKPSRIQP